MITQKFFNENNNIEIPTNISNSSLNMFSVAKDNMVNDFINHNVTLESLIEKELFKVNL